MGSQWKLSDLLNKAVEILGILVITTILGTLVLILVPLVLMYGLVVASIILWEEYGIREQSSNSSR